MPERLGDAVLDLRTDDQGLDRGIRSAKRASDGLGRGLQRTERLGQRLGTGLGRAFDTIGRRAARMGRTIALGLSAAVAGLTALTKRAIDAADEIAKTARAVGLSAETLQEWRFAAGRAGVSTRALDLGLVRFNRTLGEAQRGEKRIVDIFRAAGIALKDQTGAFRGNEAVLRDVVDALSKTENQAQRTAIVFELFGDRTGRLTPFLSQNIREIDRLRAKARELGIVISNDVARRAETAADELGDMAQVLKVAALNIGLEFMPVMQELARTITDPGFIQGTRTLALNIRDFVKWATGNAESLVRVLGAITGLALGSRFGVRGAILGAIVGGFGPELFKLLQDLGVLSSDIQQLTQDAGELETAMRSAGGGFGILDEAAEKAKKAIDDNAIALRLSNEQMKQLIGRHRDFPDTVRALTDEIELENAALALNVDFTSKVGKEWAEAFRRGQELRGVLEDVEAITAAGTTAQERYNETLARLNELLQKGFINQTQFAKGAEAAQEALDRSLEKTDKAIATQQRFADEAARSVTFALEDMAFAGDNAALSIANLERAIANLIVRLTVLEPLERSLRAALGGTPQAGLPAEASAQAGGGFDNTLGANLLTSIFGSFFGGGGGGGGNINLASELAAGTIVAGGFHQGGPVDGSESGLSGGGGGFMDFFRFLSPAALVTGRTDFLKFLSPLGLLLSLFHEGGGVGRSSGLGDRRFGLRRNERLAVLEVGEFVVPKGIASQFDFSSLLRLHQGGGVPSRGRAAAGGGSGGPLTIRQTNNFADTAADGFGATQRQQYRAVARLTARAASGRR